MKVIGIGDNVVDIYMHLDTMFPGGNALNFSVYAKSLGLDAKYIGVFGNDSAGDHIKATLRELGVDFARCRTYPGENAYAEVNVINGERVFGSTNKGGVATMHPLELNGSDIEYIKGSELIHSSCYSHIENELEKLHNLDIPISFDFSESYDHDYLKKVCPFIDFAFLSCSELTQLETKEKLEKAIDYGAKMALATKGDQGATLFFENKFYDIEARKITPVDTLGAGDAFIVAFLYELFKDGFSSKETTLKKGLKAGIDFASEVCKVYGAFNYGIEVKNGGHRCEY